MVNIFLKDSQTDKNSYNLFNIKGEGPAGSIVVSTLEYQDDKLIKVEAFFKVYYSYQESFDDYASLILRTDRYKPAVRVADSPEKYAAQLKSGIIIGYGQGIWHPKAPVTREMLAVILDRLGFLD